MSFSIRFAGPREIASFSHRMSQLYLKYYSLSEALVLQRIKKYERFALFFQNDELVGFTGIIIDRHAVISNRKYILIGIGLTVIEEACRNNSFIQKTVASLFIRERMRNPLQKIYIWTNAASYKPYLIFSQHLKTAFPTYQSPATPFANLMIEYIGAHYLNDGLHQYAEHSGCTAIHQTAFISDASVTITERDLANPNIAYYNQRMAEGKKLLLNENHSMGLVTIAPANFTNLYFWGKKVAEKKFKKLMGKKSKSIPVEAIQIESN